MVCGNGVGQTMTNLGRLIPQPIAVPDPRGREQHADFTAYTSSPIMPETVHMNAGLVAQQPRRANRGVATKQRQQTSRRVNVNKGDGLLPLGIARLAEAKAKAKLAEHEARAVETKRNKTQATAVPPIPIIFAEHQRYSKKRIRPGEDDGFFEISNPYLTITTGDDDSTQDTSSNDEFSLPNNIEPASIYGTGTTGTRKRSKKKGENATEYLNRLTSRQLTVFLNAEKREIPGSKAAIISKIADFLHLNENSTVDDLPVSLT